MREEYFNTKFHEGEVPEELKGDPEAAKRVNPDAPKRKFGARGGKQQNSSRQQQQPSAPEMKTGCVVGFTLEKPLPNMNIRDLRVNIELYIAQ